MKFTLLLYILFLNTLIACKNTTADNHKAISYKVPNLESNNPNNYLIGHWAICSDGNEKGITQYNICPEILFGGNKIARLFINHSFSESLHWDTKNDTLFLNHISFFGKDTSQMFKDVKYIIKKTDDSNYVYLTIQAQVSNNYFNLTRSKFKTIKDVLAD